jgi:hypothetical protein
MDKEFIKDELIKRFFKKYPHLKGLKKWQLKESLK